MVFQLLLPILRNFARGVKIDGICSEWKCFKAGVPQGCLLGPLLFNIYKNDVNYSVRNMALRLYTDDTTEYINADALSLTLQGPTVYGQ